MNRRSWLPALLALVIARTAMLTTGCSGAVGDPDQTPSTPPPAINDGGKTDDGSVPEAAAYLEVYTLDIWGQPLPAADTTLGVAHKGAWIPLTGYPISLAPLSESGTYVISVKAPQHEDFELSLSYDGGTGAGAVSFGTPANGTRHGLASSYEQRDVNGAAKPVYTAYLGLRHKWFSAQGRPARHGNAIELLMDGEQAWNRVHGDLVRANDSVMISTWWWESNFELVRDPSTHLTASEDERWPNTILGTLERIPATKRVLVGEFWGQDSILAFMTDDAQLRAYADAPNDKFEFMGQANETEGQFWFEPKAFRFGERVTAAYPATTSRSFGDEEPIKSTIPARSIDLTDWPVGVSMELASYHQKFMVVDHSTAYIGGMNLRRVDWDTSEHKVFEPRRMLFDATTDDRQAVAAKSQQPDMGPRKDYIMRLAGPAAQDAADIFHERWSYMRESGVDYSQNATDFQVKRDIPEVAGGLQVQVTATLPAPFSENALAETWFNAVAQAKDYIYIEDQYFRVPMLVDAIIARAQQVPALKLIVVTKPINEWTDPGCEWTYKTVAQLNSALGSRFMLLQLRSFDYVDVGWGWDETNGTFADMDTHAKNLIVDDVFFSVGSANKNNRGMVYEAELNVAVVDTTWVRETRRRILAAILPAGTPITDSADEWMAQLRDAAAWNDAVYQAWSDEGGDISLDGAPLPDSYNPRGFVYSLSFRDSSYCFIESVGADMF
jgi:phosphatidylserine/phosphatidylglycerophosphate/cardiolipin synthase-like enzyme